MNIEYIHMKDSQLDRHERVFTRWINLHLANANPPVKVTDLVNESKDGHVLLTLVEVLLGVRVLRDTRTSRIANIKNVQEAMGYLTRNKVRTGSVIASEIVSGVQRATLSLVWSIIFHFQVLEAMQPSQTDYGVSQKLLAWCQNQLKGYRGKVEVTNLTTSWMDGLAFNALLHSFNPSHFNFDAISSDGDKRLVHALSLATKEYGVPPIFDLEDFGVETPDKNMISLFLSYLYQFTRRGALSVESFETVKKQTSSEIKMEYKVQTVSSQYETSSSRATTYDVQTTTTTQQGKNETVFYENQSAGNERVLHLTGFPSSIQIQERRGFVVSPFGNLSGSSSRNSSRTTSPELKELKDEPLTFTSSPQMSWNESYEYKVATHSITSDSHVTSTTSTKMSSSKSSEDYSTRLVEFTSTDQDGQTNEKDKNQKEVEPDDSNSDSEMLIRYTVEKKIEQGPTVDVEIEETEETVIDGTVEKAMNEAEDDRKRKQNAEKDAEIETKEDGGAEEGEAHPEKEIKEDEFHEDAKQADSRTNKTRKILLVSTARISGEKNPKKTEPNERASWLSVSTDDEGDQPDSLVHYFRHSRDDHESSPPSSPAGTINFVDYLKRKLDAVDRDLFDIEYGAKQSDKESMDLQSTKKALDQHKDALLELESVEAHTYDALEEGKNLVNEKCFDSSHEEYFSDRMEATERKLRRIEDVVNKEHQRLFDLYVILLKQHLERMNDWLVRAESRMALDDDVEPTYEGVNSQIINHKTFQEDLSNHSMVNMILDMDLEDPAIDETIRDWVRVLSERWAAVWTWAEEWKKKLNKALMDWNKLREEETVLLSWLSSKEQTMDVISQTDITDEEQVKMHLNLLETLEREMEAQGTRLESLHQIGEELIKDADYHNSTAKAIWDQLEDFDECWTGISNSVKERKVVLQDAQSKVKRMGDLMKEVRTWMDEAEKLIKYIRLQSDPEKENKIQEKIELKCEEKDRNQLKVDEINRLEEDLSSNIDKRSNYYLKKVTKPFNKRWDDTRIALDRYRNDDYPFVKPDDCFLVKCLKKALVVN
ncbi:utrophin-like isoform X2 [Stylophora pistillata]|uniref:utrophin-like isoform X2 n=1 Tax=Stylophora pistillata TaxID=50429 RepID=UPI000C0448FA|nr:utrophin-like isoform X2 [Stylophora pistillata]